MTPPESLAGKCGRVSHPMKRCPGEIALKRFVTLGAESCVIALLLAVLVGCSSDSDKVRKPPPTVTPADVAWQRPQTAISQDAPIVRLTGMMRLHQHTVNDVAFSASGTRLASVGADNTTVVWNLANGEALFVLSDSDGRRVFFGPRDETLITVSQNGLARVWSMKMSPPRELQELTHFAGHDAAVGSVTQSPDLTLLAFGAENGGVRLWRIPEGEEIADIDAHPDVVQFLTFSPDGKLLASISLTRGLRVWSVPDGALVYDLGHEEAEGNPLIPLRAAFSPDSGWLAVANQTGIQLWDMKTGGLVYFVEAAQNAASSRLVYSPNGNLLVGCGAQPLIGVWETISGKQLGLLPLPGQYCANVAFSPDSTLLLTLPMPGRDLYLWNILHITDDVPPEKKMLDRADRATMGLLPGTRFFDFAWSEDGRFIVVVDELGPIYVLTAAT